MKYVYILENESKFLNEIIEAIHKINPQLMIRYFDSLNEFSAWIKTVMIEGPAALPKGGKAPANQPEANGTDHQLLLVISKDEFLGAKHLNLLRKTQELFIKKNLCTKEDPTSLVLTSFDSPDFDIKLAEDRIINNVLFKPFDKLILQQHLTFAIGGRHPASQYSVHNMKTSATIEMLKDVEIEAISDVGFISLSNRPIAPGSVAKYYHSAFLSLQHRSILAQCLTCEPHPQLKDQYRCAFTYFAADNFQISNIRKNVRQKDLAPFHYDWRRPGPVAPVEMALITSDDPLIQSFTENLGKSFKNAVIHVFSNLQDFLYTINPEQAVKDKKPFDLTKMPKITSPLQAIFADQYLFEGSFAERWQSIAETLKKQFAAPPTLTGATEFFIASRKTFSDQEERALGQVTRDIFYQPFDFLYMAKKIQVRFPGLVPDEKIEFPTTKFPLVAKAATPIEMSEFSEAGIVMKYYRPISTGAFRQFVLWLPHELNLPELPATCNYHEESKSQKGLYFNHFVFFGMTDHYLKHIRRWILQNHVQSKESEGS